MGKTYADFLTYVKYDFKRDDKDTEIIQAYNDTIRHLSGLKPLEGRKFTSWIPSVVGREDYVLPSTLIHLIHPIRIIEGAALDSGYPLNQLSRQDWSERYPNPNITDTSALSKGMPVDYCVYEGAIHVGPVPDLATYIFEIDWTKISTTQAAVSDIQPLGEDWEEVIKWGTLFRIYAGMGMDDEAAKWLGFYRDEKMGWPYLMEKEDNSIKVMGTVKYRDL
jgi:hypothetical protein